MRGKHKANLYNIQSTNKAFHSPLPLERGRG